MRRVLGTLLAGLVGTWLVGVVRALARVSPDLRTPRLLISFAWVPLGVVPVLRSRMRQDTVVPPGVGITERTVPGGVPVLLYDGGSRPSPSGALLWIHGGGHLVGHPGMDHDLAGRFAAEAGVLVVSVDYRLAPEDPFPADLDDCVAALHWLQDHAAELGVDPARIAVGGASAGGGLAAATVHRAHDDGRPVAFALLEYPMLDDRTALARVPGGRGRFVWDARMNRRAWTAYVGRPAGDPAVPEGAAPARRRDLAGLPPTWIGVGDQDLFHDEDVSYSGRLRASGVPVELHVEPGMYHGADANVPGAHAMRAFRGRMVTALRTAVGG
ncbi:alpha/beta hydrolase [Actinomycetospora corticicola]|uniref:Acetyl esterase/lipase n=1 Tax=Actinomycetospora corticicola TaxID=663602 RepID=A0A7Y9DSJ0_9PSEU|nr:acetyl esterase/lipase [Actinomycetospora corticicola]